MSVVGETVGSIHARTGPDSLWSRARSAAVLGLSLLVFLPVFPTMPSALLDASWRMALNEAWARGLDFAQGMVFTYGPYAFISTEQYAPATYPVLVVCSLFLGVVLFLLLRYIESSSRGRLPVFPIVLGLIASGYTSSPDVRFLCFSFLSLVAACSRPANETGSIGRPWLFGAPLVLNLAGCCLGLICLVKATYAVEIAAVGALSVVALYVTRRRLLACSALASFALGLVAFWSIAGQPLTDLPRFFLNQAQVAMGYGQAMGGGTNLLPPALFLFSTIPLVTVIRRELQQPTTGSCTIAIGMAITLFLSFKEGFVREDDWHVMIAAETLLLLPWCWPTERWHISRTIQAAIAGLCVLSCILSFPHALDIRGKTAYFEQLLHCSDRGPMTCPGRPGWLSRSYESALARIRSQVPLPKVRGTVDVYTVRQSLAIAYGYRWSPRPVLQSYSAYTPNLAQMNVEHLTGSNAPDGVLFALEAIDWRLPSFADGPSWPILLTRYRAVWLGIPVRSSGAAAIAYLTHKPDSARIAVSRADLFRGTAALGQVLDVPQGDDVLFATIDIRPNAYGRFEEAIFRGSELYINFFFPGGRVERYRFIPGMARAGFIISPVVTNTTQFVGLQDLKVRKDLFARRPIAFWLSGSPSAREMWAYPAVVEISRLREVRNQDRIYEHRRKDDPTTDQWRRSGSFL